MVNTSVGSEVCRRAFDRPVSSRVSCVWRVLSERQMEKPTLVNGCQ